MNWAWLLACQLAWLPLSPASYHRPSAKWFTSESSAKIPDTYFGFSVTYQTTSKRLIVSAPHEDQIGQIYSCDIESEKCLPIRRDKLRNESFSINHHYWLGAVVKAGPSFFVTCMPMYLTRSKLYHRIGTFSNCYLYKDSESPPIKLKSIDAEDRKRHTKGLFEPSMDSFGWSIDISEKHIFIGGPAIFTGRVSKYDSTNLTVSPKTLTGYYTRDEIGVEYNFGYSVVSGKFWTDNETTLLAVGSPYGEGKVSFYTQDNKMLEELRKTEDVAMVGSMFGAVLCTARLQRGSTSTALLVGAPTYATKLSGAHNVGAVYVYLPVKAQTLPKYKRTIRHDKDESFFGSAIVSVGDLDGDGGDEIAIAAPYEDNGSGAVYLYSSAEILSDKTYLQLRPMQRIAAGPPVKMAFGYSLTAVQDYDDNGCNELGIGAPKSSRVMLLKCIASVIVKTYVEIPDLRRKKNVINTNRNSTHFTFLSCLKIDPREKPKVLKAEMQVEVQIMHSEAKLVSPKDNNYIVQVGHINPICQPIVVSAPETANYAFPVRYTITAKQLHPPQEQETFTASNVAVSDLSELTTSGSIWIADCENATSCMPNLKYLNTTFSVELPYVIGSTKTVDVAILVRNDGEVAYDPCVRVTIHGSSVKNPPADCKREGSVGLLCSPKTLLKTKNIWNIQGIQLDTTELNNEDTEITIGIEVYNDCVKTDQKVSESVTIPLKADPSGVTIKGNTEGKDNMVNMTRTEMADGKQFNHVYTISNSGPTNWVDVKARVVVHKRSFIVNPVVSILKDTDASIRPTGCEYEHGAGGAAESVYICRVDRLYTDAGVATVTVSMTVLTKDPDTIILENQNTVYTKLSVTFPIVTKMYSVTSTLQLKAATIELWIYIVASLMGLLILLVIFFILRECGFLRRDNKDKLKRAKESVRRQTVRRQTMLEGIRLPPMGGSESADNLIEGEVEAAATSAPKRDKRVKIS